MTDDRQQQKKDAAEKHQVERDRLRRAWAREGYNSKAHFSGIAGEGEIQVLLNFGAWEHQHVDRTWTTREQKLPAIMAMLDISDIVRRTGGYVRQ